MNHSIDQKTLTLDCQYVFPRYAAAYLLTDRTYGTFIETNTTHCVPSLMSALKNEKIKPENVEFIIITHVHLDHAGGSSALMKACPNAKLLAHPRAAIHLIDPTKLIKSATAVYGADVFNRLYGEIEPIPEKRVRIIQDGEDIVFHSRKFHFIYTLGHAKHHFCIYDSTIEGVFTGDSFGLAYPALQKNGLFIFPSTSPTDFDPLEAKASVRKILALGAKKAFLTHYGEIRELTEAAEQLIRHLDFSEDLMNRAVSSSHSDLELSDYCEKELRIYFHKIFEEKSLASDARAWEIVDNDIRLNAAGIAFAATKLRNGK